MKIASVRLREMGNIVDFFCPFEVDSGQYVIVEVERGLDYGQIVGIREEEKAKSLKKIVRKANLLDKKQIKENKKNAEDSFLICRRKIKENKLDQTMKLIEAEYSFDRKKIIFYFTSPKRIDFRELVKELAKILKVRIEMRQIGVRDEAKLFGGIGPCGRELCCSLFLKNFEPVTMKMVKLQKLSLNPSKISGMCGRLMCCIFYEHSNYKFFSRGLPREQDSVNTPKGKGKVIAVNVLKRLVYVELKSGSIEKVYYKKDE